MSTKVGVIAEGPVDHALLPPVLERIAQDRAGYDWPIHADDVAEVFHLRKRGHGGVLEAVRKLVSVLDTEYFDHAFFVILLDRRTRAVRARVRRLLRNRHRFAMGVAIEEIEAWWLGDRENTLSWSGLAGCLPSDAKYARKDYQAEADDEPKKTLDELTRLSVRFDRCYGQGNVELALEFAEDYWRKHAKLDAIRIQCPQGYGQFEQTVTNHFRATKSAAGRLF